MRHLIQRTKVGLAPSLISIIFLLASNGFVQADEPAGVWRGEWRSGPKGHHGPMRAVVTPKPDGNYQARFTGRFALIVPFAYRVTLQPSSDSVGNPILTAEKPLGPLLGSYRMNAQTLDNQFSGNFQAAGDNGTIRMRRVR